MTLLKKRERKTNPKLDYLFETLGIEFRTIEKLLLQAQFVTHDACANNSIKQSSKHITI